MTIVGIIVVVVAGGFALIGLKIGIQRLLHYIHEKKKAKLISR